MVDLVALLQPAEDRDGVLDRRLPHEDRLEPPLERRVLLDVLAVLVEGGGADHAELTPGEGRLQHVGRVRRTLGRAGAHQRVHLVDEQDDLPLGVVISFSTALSRSSNSPRNFVPATRAPRSSARTRLSPSPSGTSRSTIRWASPSTIAVLPTPGSPIRTGLFFVRRDSTCMTRRISSSSPPDDRVELVLARDRGQVAAVLLEGLVGILGLAGHPMAAPDLAQRLEQLLAAHADPLGGGTGGIGIGQGQEDVLGREVLVTEVGPHRVGVGDDPFDLPTHAGVGAVGAGQLGQGLVGGLPQRRHVDPDLLEDDDPLRLAHQGGEDMVRGDLGIGPGPRRPRPRWSWLLGSSGSSGSGQGPSVGVLLSGRHDGVRQHGRYRLTKLDGEYINFSAGGKG